MTPDPIILPTARDPYAHRWHDRPMTWGGGPPEVLTFTMDAGTAESARVQHAILSQFCGQSLDVFAVVDNEADTLVAVSREGDGRSRVLAIEPLASLFQHPDDIPMVIDFTQAAAARRMRALLAPLAVARMDPRPLPQTHAVLVREFGDDIDVAKSARKSYRGDKRKRLPADDRKLVRYLLRHRHTSPLEQVALVFEVAAPMYVVQQLLRHRTAKLNQVSGRYAEHDCEFEFTPPGGWRAQGDVNKQGSGEPLGADVGERLTTMQAEAAEKAWRTYRAMLEAGVSREQARTILPASTMTGLVWQCDLHNLLHFLGLRLAPDAQLEIRRLAVQMAAEVARRFPWTWAAWLEFGAPKPIREMWAKQQPMPDYEDPNPHRC